MELVSPIHSATGGIAIPNKEPNAIEVRHLLTEMTELEAMKTLMTFCNALLEESYFLLNHKIKVADKDEKAEYKRLLQRFAATLKNKYKGYRLSIIWDAVIEGVNHSEEKYISHSHICKWLDRFFEKQKRIRDAEKRIEQKEIKPTEFVPWTHFNSIADAYEHYLKSNNVDFDCLPSYVRVLAKSLKYNKSLYSVSNKELLVFDAELKIQARTVYNMWFTNKSLQFERLYKATNQAKDPDFELKYCRALKFFELTFEKWEKDGQEIDLIRLQDKVINEKRRLEHESDE